MVTICIFSIINGIVYSPCKFNTCVWKEHFYSCRWKVYLIFVSEISSINKNPADCLLFLKLCVVTPSGGGGGGDTATSVTLEQEKYFAALVAATPMGNRCYADSLTGLGSVVLHCASTVTSVNLPVLALVTPVALHQAPMAFLASGLRSSVELAMCM